MVDSTEIPEAVDLARQSEHELVRRAQRGDSQALGQLYQRHVDRVYSYVLFRVRDEALAEDLTQDVFFQALRSLESFDWRGAVAPWLMRIARNMVIDHWRRTGRRPEWAMSALADDDEDGEDRRMERLSAEEDDVVEVELFVERERIIQAASRLTELQRQVVALRFASGLSIRETAEVMGKSEGAVKNLQHHALRSLRRVLASYEVNW